ncbi:MAG: hypothetical protein HQK89_14055 [Nitrospirae bacterium]|nr:hypothetical protein [Nitrospirota bacterium]
MKYLTLVVLLSFLFVFSLQPSYAWYEDCNAADSTKNVGFATEGRYTPVVENENCAFVFLRLKTDEGKITGVEVLKGNFNETVDRSEQGKAIGLEKK